MDTSSADEYLVYLRQHLRHGDPPETAEEPLMTCATYEEARQVQLAHQRPGRECVIRFIGETGGG
jgi:hypothetical protein